jgi:hypothetical protein
VCKIVVLPVQRPLQVPKRMSSSCYRSRFARHGTAAGPLRAFVRPDVKADSTEAENVENAHVVTDARSSAREEVKRRLGKARRRSVLLWSGKPPTPGLKGSVEARPVMIYVGQHSDTPSVVFLE